MKITHIEENSLHKFLPPAWGLTAILKQIKVLLTDTNEYSKLVHSRIWPKMDTLFSSVFLRRVRATSMTQRRVGNAKF